MAGTNSPYISKPAVALVNPTTASLFQQIVPVTPNSSIVQQVAYVKYEGWSQFGSGVSNSINVIRFIVRASGRATGGATTNFTPALRIGSVGTTVPALSANFTTVLGALTAVAFNTASGNWAIDASLQWDPTSGQVNGAISGFAGSGGAQTFTAQTAITPATGFMVAPQSANVNAVYSAGELQLFFACTGLFSASNANNTCTLDSFSVETI